MCYQCKKQWGNVSALAAEWIEMSVPHPCSLPSAVSALAAEWIEIGLINRPHLLLQVSALAAEWIEISGQDCNNHRPKVSALAAEWIEIFQMLPLYLSPAHLSPPSRRSGLK